MSLNGDDYLFWMTSAWNVSDPSVNYSSPSSSGNVTPPGNGTNSSSSSAMTVAGGDWKTEEELQAIREQTILVVQKILFPIVVLFGCFGNTITIVVLTRPWMKSSTNYYLTILAIYDVLYLIFAFSMSFQHYAYINVERTYAIYRAYIGRTLTDIWSNTGIWLTVTFTVERYIVVCHPMKGKVWCTTKRAKQILVAVCCSAAVATFPEFFSLTTFVEPSWYDPSVNITKVTKTDFAKSPGYMFGYEYINQALFTFLPLVLLSVFNTLLIRALIAAAKRRKLMTQTSQDGSSSDQQRITLMLICVVIVFLFCQLPSAVSLLYQNIIIDTATVKQRLLLKITGSVFNLLVMINSSVNFILYSSFSTKFRVTFKRVFCKCVDGGEQSKAGGRSGAKGHGQDARSKPAVGPSPGLGSDRSNVRYSPVAQKTIDA